jgi:hypothetical protein
VAKFAIDDISYNYQLVIPNPRYTLEMRSGILSNKTLKVPYSQCFQRIFYGSGGNETVLNVPVGPVDSLNAMYVTQKSNADIQSQASDNMIISKPYNLSKWYFQLGSQMIPQGRRWSYSSTGAAEGMDQEASWLAMVSQAGAYDNEDFVPNAIDFNTKTFKIGTSFSGSSTTGFGTGWNLTGDQNCRIYLQYSQPLPQTVRLTVTYFVDSYVVLGNGFVQVVSRDLHLLT